MRINYAIYLGMLLLMFCNQAFAQQTYRTEVYRDDIKSLEVKVRGELVSLPCITLDSDQQIEISFDALHHSSGRFAYRLIHCDANRQASTLLPIEFMKGFQDVFIEDYTNSINTLTHYFNYKLFFPNEDIRLLVSGNYAVEVYEEDEPEEVVFTACFSVVEPLVEIETIIKTNTDIDFNAEHQQIDLNINTTKIDIAFPQSDLKIIVCQNRNINDLRTVSAPVMMLNRQLQYRHDRNLIFKAGNEYRRIEFLTHRYDGMGVERTVYFNPYYNVTLYPNRRRDNKPYLYDQDQNGRFFVRCSQCANPDSEADYYIVHFSLVSERIEGGDLHLYGEMFNNIISENSRMEYNEESGAYEKAVMLKLGQYNYLYAFAPDGDATAVPAAATGRREPIYSVSPDISKTEGSFSETENEYAIAVYYRPAGARYDRLIGFAKSN